MDFKETETIPNGIGSGFSKQKQRSVCDENDLVNSKMLKTDFSVGKDTDLQRSNSQHQMLSFSPLKSHVSLPSKGTILSEYQQAPALYSKNAEYYGPGSLNPNMHGTFPGFRGPFTPSQWIELEHQALIYKYLNSNVPVPSNLLIPIRNSLNSLRMIYGSSAGSLPPLSWNSFQFGFSTNNDPEPGRCRRTDGKKWRCSRDAVIDQKYCERHINRGRHRSRKPVEGQTGHALSGTTLTTSKLVSNGSASNNLNISLNQFMSIAEASPSTGSPVNRTQDRQGISTLSPSINTKSSEGPFEESSNSDFGFVSSDSLLNPSTKNSYMNSKNYPAGQEQHPLHRFIDACPKNNTDRSTMTSWPEELKSDWTQLSMSTSSSMGGPLGEVLNSTTSLKLMESSPIGVLLKASFT